MAYQPSMSHSMAPKKGLMPLLTRKGFIDITTIEVLADPSKEWGHLRRALQMYDLPAIRGWGDLPRNVLPDYPDERMLQRVKNVTAFAQAKGQEELAAAQVEAQIRAQGRQNAIDLISDTRYVYTYR